MTMMIGFGDDQREASRETVTLLIEKWKGWHPGISDAEAEAALHMMSPGERARMAMNRHDMDQGQAVLGDACIPDREPVRGPIDDGLPAPGSGMSSSDHGWYR